MRRIAVIMGGESAERDVSRVSGTAVARALAERGHEVVLLDTRTGEVPLAPAEGGPAIGTRPPEPGRDAAGVLPGPTALAPRLDEVDAVFVALHGGWGEDGTIQAWLELIGVPYTGSGVLGSALSMDKERAKRVMRSAGVPTPDWRLLEVDASSPPGPDEVAAALAGLDGRLVVKPNAEGSTVGLSILPEGADAAPAVATAARYGRRVLVERYVPGRELTVAVVGRPGGGEEALPVVEIVPESGFYDYEAKYTKGRTRYVAPAELPEDVAAGVRARSAEAFRALACEGFARIDWRLDPDGAAWCLECNTIPGMTATSLVPMAAAAAGLGFGELVERLVELAIARGARRPRSAGGVATGGGR